MATSTRHNLCEIPINFIDQNLHQVRQISDTYVNERLNQASKVNQNWCTSYNKKFNVGWIINANSIFFFQYLATKTNAKKTLVEFPKGQRISTPEHVKIFQRNKDLYAIVIYPTVIQIAKILSSKDEKELIEIINFPVEGEKIIALSDSWEESSAIFLSVLTNKNSVYLIELEPRIAESKINLNISLQILHRKPVSLLQKLKSYIAPTNDLEDPQVFCCMETSDRPGASVRTYNIFSYVEGRLEFWTITLKSHDDKYDLFSQTHKWAIDLRLLLDHEFSQKLFEKYRKLADFEVLDFKPTLVRNQGQVVLVKLLARVNEINHQCFEGHFSFATVTLDDVNGAILKFDENVLHDGFRVSREELHDKDQIFYGRIVSILDNDDVHTCCHFSLRPKKGVYEESSNNGALQNLTHTNLYTAIESNAVYSVAIEGKILGAGHYFSYEENAEDVLFITTENSLIKMKVLKYLAPTAFSGQLPTAQPSNTREQPIISFDDLEEFSSRLVIALHTRNQIALKFKDMLNNAKDNLLGVKEELDELLKTRKLEEIKEGIMIYTNELLNDKTRNMVLLSTFTPSNQAKINQWSSESLDILTFELKKKVNVLYSWIEFLKKFHIWDIDSSIKEHAYSNLEKLIGAIKLCEEQTLLERLESDSRIKEERKALLSQAVEACMNTWKLTPSLDVNLVNTNVFYTQIDKFEDFLIHLIQYHQDYVNDNHSYDHMHFLADLIVTTFHELHKLRDMQEYENLFLWTQEENLLDHLFKVIQLFEKVLLSNAWNVSERQEDLARISYILIREYNNLYKRHPNEEKWKRELNRVYETLFRHQLFERAGDFAEEFVHMDILARLYYECNYNHHITDLFVKWADKKFLEEFVHNYIQSLKENKLDTLPKRFILLTDFQDFSQQIIEILHREYPQVGWLLKLTEGNLTRADQLIEQSSLKESVLRNRIASTSAGRFIHNQGTYEKVLRVDHLQKEGNISQEKIVDPETLVENILAKENEEHGKVIEDCIKILANIRGNEYYQNISSEQYNTMLGNVIGKALEFDDKSIQQVDKLLNVPQGAQSNQIYNIIRETTLYRVIKDLLEIAKTEGTDLQTIVGNTNNNDPVAAKFIQKLISLN